MFPEVKARIVRNVLEALDAILAQNYGQARVALYRVLEDTVMMPEISMQRERERAAKG
jgi:hypothetical protein